MEAAGSLADGRVVFVKDSESMVEARVSSSLGDRIYRVIVKVNPDGSISAYSNDNGTKFRGYVGYPIIAVLMAKNMLPKSPDVERSLAGIPWRELNERFKSYDRVLEEVYKIASNRGVSREKIEKFIGEVLSELAKMRIYRLETEG